MALVDLPQLLYLPDVNRRVTTVSALTLDGTNLKLAIITTVRNTFTLSKLHWRTNGVTSAQTVRLGVYTVDSSGLPTTTQYGGSGYGTQAAPAAATVYEMALGTPASMVAGDDVAFVWEWDGAAGNLQIATGAVPNNWNKPCSRVYTSSWAAASSVMPLIGLEDNSGACIDHGFMCYLSAGVDSRAVNSATYDEVALAFTLPVKSRVVGYWASLAPSAGGDWEAILYSGTSAQVTRACDADARNLTAGGFHQEFFATPFTCEANTQYRMAIRPTTPTAVGIVQQTLNSAKEMGGLALGTSAYWSQRLDQGAWSDNTAKRPAIGLIIDQLDAGGGGSIFSGMVVR